MNPMIYAAEINPMYYGTLAFLLFAGMLASIGFWAIHSVRRNDREEANAASAAAQDSRSRTAE
ncbi:MAG: hypothetical protein QOC81_1248 [Thermoanaerobaculia bacterium]|jgi:hypothetical protein|nr:hypothetical protein [Thermoanaerobaculia bacterium]